MSPFKWAFRLGKKVGIAIAYSRNTTVVFGWRRLFGRIWIRWAS